MGFEADKDKKVEEVVVCDSGSTRVKVGLYQYNGGAVKLGIGRENQSKGSWTFAKLGRMSPAEFSELVPVGLEMLERHGLLH